MMDEELKRGIAIMTPPGGLAEKLALARKEKRPLIVKLGFDPTAPDLHLGHAVVLRKVREFQKAGHKIVIIIGDFTARIGDPTGRNKTRPPLSDADIKINAKTYFDQLGKVLDVSALEVRYNAEWLDKMSFTDVIRLLSRMTVAQMLQREGFHNRYSSNTPIALHELLYPMVQGYDSLELQADIEMGGTDQLFNCLVGRTLQEAEGKPGQVVLSMPLLVGLDGTEKMSKSKNNYIGLTEEPNQMYGKAMSIPDALLENYLDLVTDFTPSQSAEMKKGLAEGTLHPMEIKKAIAQSIVRQYHGEAAGLEADQFFYTQFQQKNEEEKTYQLVEAAIVFGAESEATLLDVCAKLEPDHSRSQIRRLIESSSVTVGGEKITDPVQKVARPAETPLRIKIGKRGFFEIGTQQ